MTVPIILDCDPGHDDALAILLALASPDEIDVLAITTVAGNVPLPLTSRNARLVCELAGRTDVPVHAGCDRPLVRPLVTAEHVHGGSGLDGVTFADPTLPMADGHAVDVIVDTVRTRPGEITLVPTGPLTNIARALLRAPDLAAKVSGIVLMGGAAGFGNITPSAEFNFYVDPDAAAIVLRSGIPVVMHGLDVTHRAIATPDRLAAIAGIGTPVAETVSALLAFYDRDNPEKYGAPGAPLHDPCTIAWLIDPGIFVARQCHVAVETAGEETVGRSAVDWWGVTGRSPNARVVHDLDADRFFALLTERLARL